MKRLRRAGRASDRRLERVGMAGCGLVGCLDSKTPSLRSLPLTPPLLGRAAAHSACMLVSGTRRHPSARHQPPALGAGSCIPAGSPSPWRKAREGKGRQGRAREGKGGQARASAWLESLPCGDTIPCWLQNGLGLGPRRHDLTRSAASSSFLSHSPSSSASLALALLRLALAVPLSLPSNARHQPPSQGCQS